ncbi:histidine phosphatase family protein [Candidatus Shapirobacteria bacterium]|nr:histidine phosphatase family protein [Candidatus Shapirobacteria bacterium]
MNILFVRHARSENDDANRRQGPNSKLGEVGRRQALLAAERVNRIIQEGDNKYDLIITSPWLRALETAKVIAGKTGIKVEKHPLIHEYLSNKILIDQPMDSDIVKEFKEAARNKGVNLDWRFRGEGECVRDVINRAINFKNELLSKYLGKNCLVVSHGLFITSFITILMLGDHYDDAQFQQISELIHLENTSFSEVEYDEFNKRWQIKYLNDFSHLEKIFAKNKITLP